MATTKWASEPSSGSSLRKPLKTTLSIYARRAVVRLAVGAVFAALVGSAQTNLPQPVRINLQDYDPPPAGAPAAAAPTAPAPHVLHPGDLILIEVYQEPDLTARRRISADGSITLNYFENEPIRIGGKTYEEAQAIVQALYEKDVLVNPRVTITLLEAAKWKFIIMGEVARPDTYEVSGDGKITLVHAVAMAGGATSKGNIKNVTVTRFVNNTKQVLKLDINRMMNDSNSKPFQVEAGDIISVGERVF